MTWELVLDETGRSVRRLAVPGGWLYQVEIDWLVEPVAGTDSELVGPMRHVGWCVPVFVPHGARP